MRKAAWLLAAVVLHALPCAAQERPLIFRVGAGSTWDSNIFRVPDGAPDPQAARGIDGKSDRYSTGFVGLALDKSYAQQRFVVDVTERLVRYDNFDTLDRDELSYRAEWQWRVASRLDGSLYSRRSESLVPFEDTVQSGLIETVNTDNGLTANVWLYGGWYVVGGLSESKRVNSQTFLAQPNSRQSNHDLGVRYTSDAENSITYVRRSSRGTNFGDVIDISLSNDFRVHESSLTGTWNSGGAQTISGRLYHTEYRYPATPSRDFSGNGGELNHTWVLTGALVSNFSFSRTVTPWTLGLQSSHRVDRTVTFAPIWRATEKIDASVRFARMETEYRGALFPGLDRQREDVQDTIGASASWRPFDRVALTASFERQSRSSTDPTAPFEARIVALDASVAF